jgi:excisionase family DNA binding protein
VLKKESDTMSIREFCKTMGVGRNSAYNAINAGEIPHLRIGKRILISRKIVAEMLDPLAPANGQQSTPVQSTPVQPDEPQPVRRGGARLNTENLDEFVEIIDALSGALQKIGDLVTRLRIIRDDLVERARK